MNSILTVRAYKTGSHRNRGWEQFTNAVIRTLNDGRNHLVFMLLGCAAQGKRTLNCGLNIILRHIPKISFSAAASHIPSIKENDNRCLSNSAPAFTLSWSHYLVLMRIENPEARSFYEIECADQQWSVRQLSRQVDSCLYERLALSRNKDEVMRLARKGQTVEKPSGYCSAAKRMMPW